MNHAGGATAVTVDQVQNNGQWVLLGTYSFTPGSGHKVSHTDQADGYVIADAIRLSCLSNSIMPYKRPACFDGFHFGLLYPLAIHASALAEVNLKSGRTITCATCTPS